MTSPDGRAGGLRLLVNTQTPLIRFREGSLKVDGSTRLADLKEGEDYKHTTGGVTRMLLPLLRRWRQKGHVGAAEWVAMGADEHVCPRVEHEGIGLSFVGVPATEKAGYATVKERLWALLNANPNDPTPPEHLAPLPEEAWAAFASYQRRSAACLQTAAARMGGVDLLYVHDFQQVGVAEAWEGVDIPKVFHLHTPFPSVFPEPYLGYLLDRLRHYDAVIVSTHRYAANLRSAGLDVPLHVVPPFIDPEDYREPTPEDVATFRARYGVSEDDAVILNVGRMDPMKGQDRLVRAMPHVLARRPDARLVLVGNGSFSSSRTGGLGLSKGQAWRAHLEGLAAELGVAHRVTFTGHLGDDLIPAAYEACKVFALPSTREGFGLAAIEAWRRRKPIIVSDRTGVAEVVDHGANGLVVDCADTRQLAEAIVDLLERPDAAKMGEAGEAASDVATLPSGSRALRGIIEQVLAARGVKVVA